MSGFLASIAGATYAPAVALAAVAFDGTDDYYSATGITSTATDGFYATVAITFYYDGSNGDFEGMLNLRLGAADGNWGLVVGLAGGTKVRLIRVKNNGSDGGEMYLDSAGDTALVTNGWNQVVFWHKGDNATASNSKCWVNGVAQTVFFGGTMTNTSLAYNWGHTTGQVWIGRHTTDMIGGAQPFFKGRYSQIYIHNGQTSAPDINKFWNSTSGLPHDLGTNGTATGLAQPLIYHYGNTSTFPTNNGTGFSSYTLTQSGGVVGAAGPTYGTYVASFTSVKNTLTDIDATQQGFRHTRVIFMGDDSSQNPVFAYAYRDNSDFYIKIVAFRVNKSTGALTIGTPGTVIQVAGDPDNNFYSPPALSGENSDAGTRTTSYSNYGYVGFYHGGSTNVSRMFAFSVDVSTLAVTVGTGVSHFSAIDSGVCSMTYVGNSRAVFGMRGGGGSRYYNMFSRSGTTLTSVATATQSANAGTAGNFLGEAAVVNSGTNYRMATVSSAYGLDTIQWATTTYYIDQEPIANIFSNKDFSGTTGWVLPLNGTDKFVMSMYNATDTAVYAQAVSVSWGSTTPTNTVGTRLTLTGTDNSPLAFAPGGANDEFYYIYESGSTIRYRKITASGTTLTQGSEVDTTLSSTNLTGSSRYEIAKSASGDYLVGVVDDSTSAIWQVVAVKLT